MRRIRAVFVGLAVALMVPIVLLVDRALESVAIERRVSHRAVGERVLDEMERQLSEFLRAEEERPFSDYEFDAGALSDRDAPFVTQYFQVDPDGRFRSQGLGAGRKNAERERSGAPEAELKLSVLRGLEAPPVVRWVDRAAPAPREDAPEVDPRWVGDADEAPEKGDLAGADSAEPPRVSPYSALQALNRAAQDRGDRQVKHPPAKAMAKKSAPAEARVYARLEESAVTAEAAPDREAERDAASAGRLAAANAPRAAVAREGFSAGAAAPLGARHSSDAEDFADIAALATAPRVRADSGAPELEVHPLQGRLIDGARLLLHRNVFVGDRRYRQGLVVNLLDLFAQLDAVVADSPDLAPYVHRQFGVFGRMPERSSRPGFYEQIHRFAEPFGDLAVRIDVAALPGAASSGYLYAIAGLLLFSVPVGLLAIYRMVAVTVRFAERRNNFVAAVSHELKTPLTAIRMHAEMLRDDMVPDEAKRREYYGTITAESERLTRLINNVLEFSRLEQGTRELNLSVGAVGPVVAEAAELLRPHAREAGFDLSVEIAAGLPPVRYDRDAVLQVVFNLVDNALKYARDAGDRRIRIRCAQEGEGVVVAVSDRGRGVEARHLAHIFDPFYRGGSELTRTAKGTGIGLALVQGLAETMGAAVSGRNLRDGGFEVSLRFRTAVAG